MSRLRLTLVCLFLGLVALPASATKINILDPDSFPTFPVVAPDFSFNFSPCVAGELPDPNLTEAGCFAGVNRTGSPWVQLALEIPDFGHSFDCNTDDAPNQIFHVTSCGLNPATGLYDLVFTSGSLTLGQIFFVTEDDIDPALFPTVMAHATLSAAATTPEPSALLLLSTGLAATGGLLWQRRRRTGTGIAMP